MTTRQIYCIECADDVSARLTDGSEVYSHRPDLHKLPFWKCDACGNTVGCHHRSKNNKTKPLGHIANAEIKQARRRIHAKLDPLWQSKRFSRKEIYKILSKELGYEYHTAEVKSVEEVDRVIAILERVTI